MKVKGFIFAILIHWTICAEQREFYSSTDHLIKLLEVGKDLVKNLGEYITAEEAILKSLKRVLVDLSELTACVDSLDELEEHVSNPLTAYRLVRNLRTKWTVIEETVEKSPLSEFLKMVKLKSQALPTDRDVNGIALALIRLQDTYQLEPTSIMGREQSVLTGMVAATSLGPDETFHIAMVAYKNLKYPLYISWLAETMRLLNLGVGSLHSLTSFLQTDNLPTELSFIKQLVSHDPTNIQGMVQQMYSSTLRSVLQALGTRPLNFNIDSLIPRSLYSNPYEALCRGKGLRMAPGRQKKLFCRYSHGEGSAPWLYAPIKLQEEWDSPPIVRYLEIISDQEIDAVKRLSRPKLERAMVIDHTTGHKYSTESRVSKSTWLKDEEDPVIRKLSQRISDITGLDMTTAESLQVANYGIGGQYEPHFDSKLGNDPDHALKGGRIATILIYMSDVKLGGSTVFPDIGAEILPQKGSAVLWYNILRNGLEDDRTLHAACPVFLGSKWVANKWVRMRGQEFRRRCSLSPTE
ncbi:prolyl 4-hydroxylase subunit alpha-2-like [Sardina pilchardus]|uniref:prolyl 4-hydroxylase subunit alpha-2-like n=1 Tax=Sardina pilchardus TaxID=27697 RepID=UPI002E119292